MQKQEEVSKNAEKMPEHWEGGKAREGSGTMTQDGIEPGVTEEIAAGKDNASVANGFAVNELAGEEVRGVQPPVKTGSLGRPLVVLLVLVLVLGGAFYLVKSGLLTIGAAPQIATVQLQPQLIRMPIERPIEEVSVESKPVSAAESSQPPQKSEPTVMAETKSTLKEKTIPPAELYSVLVGPYLSTNQLEAAALELRKLGYGVKQTEGRGMVTMTRLLEGVYPPSQAHQKLAALSKVVDSAFLLRSGKDLALYAGSFADPARAAVLMEQLARKGVSVRPVAGEIEMNGKMLLAVQADLQTAKQLAAQIEKAGFKTQLKK